MRMMSPKRERLGKGKKSGKVAESGEEEKTADAMIKRFGSGGDIIMLDICSFMGYHFAIHL